MTWELSQPLLKSEPLPAKKEAESEPHLAEDFVLLGVPRKATGRSLC